LNSTTADQRQLRSKAEVARFFGDLELVEPGLVQVAEWRPDPADARVPASAHAVRSGRGGRWAGTLKH
jgi:hypothetical protein